MLTFHRGGIHPNDKKITKDVPIERTKIPSILVYPLSQHIGAPATPVVKPKDYVKKGALIAEASAFMSANIHASTSGTILKIDRSLTPSGQYCQAIYLEPDGKDEWEEGKNVATSVPETKEAILSRIKECGIIGMGGAGFPTHIKLNPPPDKKIDTLIINGAECEPFLTADHRLMLESSDAIIKGIDAIYSILDPATKVYLAIEDNKPNAISVMKQAALQSKSKLKVLPLKTKYPQGDERTLIEVITKRRLKFGMLPFDLGCIVQNLGTTFAIYEALYLNKPLIERVTTISGGSIHTATNKKVLLGTLFKDLLSECGGLYSDVVQVIAGGPMMGKSQYSLEVPVIKTSSGVLFLDKSSFQPYDEKPCINCGKCLQVCPQGLAPKVLAQLGSSYQFDKAVNLGVKSCIECGCCSFICPAKRELVGWIRFCKSKLPRPPKK